MSTYDDASLVLVPSGYKNGVVFSQKPMDANGQLTFTRASGATRVGPNGYIEKVRTNTIPYSQDFSNAAWVKDKNGTGVIPVVTSNNATAPDGTMTADTIVFNSGAGTTTGDSSVVYQAITASGLCTSSFYARVTSGTGQLIFRSVAGSTYTTANLTTTWQRFSAAENGSSGFFEIGLRRGLSNEPINSSITAELWGAQLETGDIATDYIATTTAAVSVGPVSGTPRLDYLNGECPSLLLEPQRTNFAQFSEQFNNAYWTKTNATITANNAVSPDGYTNADLLTYTTSAGLIVSTAYAGSATTATSVSLFVKAGTSNLFNFGISDGILEGWYYTFNLATQTATLTVAPAFFTSPSFKIENYGNGWYRLVVSAVSTVNGQIQLIAPSVAGLTANYSIYGAQVEVGAYATSYIPTLGTSVTRVADFANKTGISSILPAQTGTLYVEFDWQKTPADVQVLSIHNNSTGLAWINKETTTSVQGTYFASGYIGNISGAVSASAGIVKVAYAWVNGRQELYINGTKANSATASISDSNVFSHFEFNGFWGIQKNGTSIQTALVFPTALSDSQLAELTTL